MKMRKVIVTGSRGFIGSALCRELERRGVDVTGIDRKAGSLVADLPEIMGRDTYACVFHLAAQTSVFNTDLHAIEEDNIRSFMTAVEACNAHGVKLVYASSSTANPQNTTSMYGLSKRFDERFADIYCKKATGVRLHNVYGPNPRQGTLLFNLVNQGEVTLYNGGLNRRCFTYIDDAVSGLIMAAEMEERLVNVVNPEPVSVLDFAREVQRYNGVRLSPLAQTRKFDNGLQAVDVSIKSVPLRYTTMAEGVRRVFLCQQNE